MSVIGRFMPLERKLPANHPDSNELLMDLADHGLPYTTTKDRFHEFLAIVAGQDAAVLWDRDIAPQIGTDVPWSMHDGGDIHNTDHGEMHRCVRVYMYHHAAAWHRNKRRWYVTAACGSNGHQTKALKRMFDDVWWQDWRKLWTAVGVMQGDL